MTFMMARMKMACLYCSLGQMKAGGKYELRLNYNQLQPNYN